MSKKEKLLQIMYENNINEVRYTKEFDINSDIPCGTILIVGEENPHVTYKLWKLLGDKNGDPFDNQVLFICMMQPGDKYYSKFYKECTEVMYANLSEY